MDIYIYCADASWDTSKRAKVSELTPRCWFNAASRSDACKIFTSIEEVARPRGRQFGAAGFRKETKRENARLRGGPSLRVPYVDDYLSS